MSPGFILLLSVVFLATVSPIVLAAAVGCFFFPSAVWIARSVVRSGLIGAVVGAAWWLLALLGAAQPQHLSWPEGAALCAAGFSVGAVVGVLVSALRHKCRRLTHHSSGPPSAAAELKR